MDNRECRANAALEVEAPILDYLPKNPRAYAPGIGLIGCGGISPYHLRAYRAAGYRVVAVCDPVRERAEERRAAFFPDASVHTDYRAVLEHSGVDVADVATHVDVRSSIVEAALKAGKHVLSQKPFVTDLDEGERVANLADEAGLKLAVNQNGRWAPHFSYIRRAIAAGLLGDVTAVHLGVHWDHNWTADTPFNDIRHLILYDFAVHWFDIVNCFFDGREAMRVYASTAHSPDQRTTPPLLAQAVIEFAGGQASLAFDADTRFGALDRTIVIGTRGTATSEGPDLNAQRVTLTLAEGKGSPVLEGDWFANGFHGTMAELLCAIEENRQPYHNARHNLGSLALCFAAIASAEDHSPKTPGTVRKLPT